MATAQAMSDMSEVAEKTETPLVRMVMEIIRHDSLMHHRVQQFLIDSITKEDVPVSREDIAEIWDRIVEHDKIEKKTIELAKALRERTWSPVQQVLFDYLINDEQKHDQLLDALNQIKAGMTRASGA
jgi:uncharacterized protein YbcC (UPF0753/DUF2309 family)